MKEGKKMNEFEALSFYGTAGFSVSDEGDLLTENLQSTIPHTEKYDLDVPF